MAARGERNGQAKLTEAAVLDIRRRYIPRLNTKDLAYKHGVSCDTIRSVVAGRVWYWLD